MSPLSALFEADRIAFKRWFKTQTISKLIVFGLFLLVFSGITVVIYTVATFFFKNLAAFPPYGADTSFYLLHAALLTVSWFAIASSIIAASGFLLGNNSQLQHLLALPVRPVDIARWFFGKTIIFNCVILVFLLTPIIFAYSIAFHGGIVFDIVMRFVLATILIVLSVNSLGVIVGYTLAPVVNAHRRISAIAMFFIFLGVSVALLRFMFPPTISLLYSADSEQYFRIYNSLPLTKPWLTSYWLTRMITNGIGWEVAYLIAMTTALVLLAERMQRKYLISLWQRLHSQEEQKSVTALVKHETKFMTVSRPLVHKDVDSILRLPSELGYGIFLLGLAAFFFMLLMYFSRLRLQEFQYQKELLLFTFVWMIFFATTLYLRLIFPLMAREGRSVWYLFSLPVPPGSIMNAKVRAGLWISLPMVIIAVFMWSFYPFVIPERTLFICASVIVLVTLAIAHAYLGGIYPSFELGDEPEKVSTTTMGIATLAVSLFIGGFITFILYSAIYGIISQPLAFVLCSVFAILTIFILKSLNHLAQASYQL